MKLFIQNLLYAASSCFFLSQGCVAMMSSEDKEDIISPSVKQQEGAHKKGSPKSVSFAASFGETKPEPYAKYISRSFRAACEEGNDTTGTNPPSSFESSFSMLDLNPASGLNPPKRSETPEKIRNGRVASSSVRTKPRTGQSPLGENQGVIRILGKKTREVPNPLSASTPGRGRRSGENSNLERSCGNLPNLFDYK